MTVVRLLTLNTLFRGDVRARLTALGALLDRAEYDVVCLQEVVHRGSARLLHRAARSYTHRADSGAVALRGGLTILSRWPIRRSSFTRYPPTRPVRPELLMRKGAQCAVVAVPGGDLAVVNTHLSANMDDDWSPGNRYTRIARAELRRLAELVSTVEATLPLVAVGDFNVPRDAATLAEFATATGLHDVLAGDTRPTYRPTPTWPTPPALDHVFVRSAPGRPVTARARPVFQETVRLPDGREAYLSDHYGIEAELTLTPAV